MLAMRKVASGLGLRRISNVILTCIGVVESDFARLRKFGIVKLVTESGRKVVRLQLGQFLTPQQSAATTRSYSRPDR